MFLTEIWCCPLFNKPLKIWVNLFYDSTIIQKVRQTPKAWGSQTEGVEGFISWPQGGVLDWGWQVRGAGQAQCGFPRRASYIAWVGAIVENTKISLSFYPSPAYKQATFSFMCEKLRWQLAHTGTVVIRTTCKTNLATMWEQTTQLFKLSNQKKSISNRNVISLSTHAGTLWTSWTSTELSIASGNIFHTAFLHVFAYVD